MSMSGAELILAERERQIAVEGWTSTHDDTHDNYELAAAACCYAQMGHGGPYSHPNAGDPPTGWPLGFDDEWWKPSTDIIKNLVKAGALIAAEIDRIKRTRGEIP